MKLKKLEFDWDSGNTTKCEVHGILRHEIEAFFSGHLQIVNDLKHSLGEERFIAVGYGPDMRPMFVVFSLRTKEERALIRPISARFMHPKEARKYEKAHPKVKNR